jgi:hypothetical protein
MELIMIRNANVAVGSLVAVGTDNEIELEAIGQLGVVLDIKWPAKEGRGRRNYIATVEISNGCTYEIPTKFLSAVTFTANLMDMVVRACNDFSNSAEVVPRIDPEPETLPVESLEQENEPAA